MKNMFGINAHTACALSGLLNFRIQFVGRRFALPYAIAHRAVGALSMVLNLNIVDRYKKIMDNFIDYLAENDLLQ